MWEELWIEREVVAGELAIAVADAHGVEVAAVEVIDGIAGAATRPNEVEVRRIRAAGEFALRIQLAGAAPVDRRLFCARLASALGCKVMGDDGTVNPSTFLLYSPGDVTRVVVDGRKLDEHAPVVCGPYVASEDDEHPTRPIRREMPASHRATRGGHIAAIVNEYMLDGLPRPPLVEWSTEIKQVYDDLQRLLGTLAFRKASDDEVSSVRRWREALATAFVDPVRAGWFVVELLQASDLLLAGPWDPEQPIAR